MICGRPETGEEYLCEKLDDGQHGHAGAVNPIVRVLAVLAYPRQRAIYWPEVVSEAAPVPGGCICRLPFLREATEEEAGRYGSWEQSAAELQRAYLARCGSEEEAEILRRHLEGRYRPRRSVRIYKEYELRAAQEGWERVRNEELGVRSEERGTRS